MEFMVFVASLLESTSKYLVYCKLIVYGDYVFSSISQVYSLKNFINKKIQPYMFFVFIDESFTIPGKGGKEKMGE